MSSFLTLPLGITNTYLIHGQSNQLIDACPKNKLKKLEKLLRTHNQNIKDINYILVAHFHWDHIGSLAAIRETSGAKIMVREEEKEAVQIKYLLL